MTNISLMTSCKTPKVLSVHATPTQIETMQLLIGTLSSITKDLSMILIITEKLLRKVQEEPIDLTLTTKFKCKKLFIRRKITTNIFSKIKMIKTKDKT